MVDKNTKMKPSLDAMKKARSIDQDETLWGKPANDIRTGIHGNTDAIRPERAIWEMVQNARDVAQSEGAEIEFIAYPDKFIFQHNGKPFDNKSLLALIMQTSSKPADDPEKVGQYGTGFLVTHKFGLCFLLSSSVRFMEESSWYYHFNDFCIDRSECDDKGKMINCLKEQCKETDRWISDESGFFEYPAQFTKFSYGHLPDSVESEHVKTALKQSPRLTPYVLAFNQKVKSITYKDYMQEVPSSITFRRISEKEISETESYQWIEFIYEENGTRESLQILRSKLTFCYDKKVTDDYGIESMEKVDTGLPLVSIILPIKKEENNHLRVTDCFVKQIPNVYKYLPLLGTNNWGINYVLNSMAFTCSTDARDSLNLAGNGQTTDKYVMKNIEVVDLAYNIISHFIQNFILNDSFSIKDRHLLAHVSFRTDSQNEKLIAYYQSQQEKWRLLYMNLPLALSENRYVNPSTLWVMSKDLLDACQENHLLLEAVYRIFLISHPKEQVPDSCYFLYWSEIIHDWYLEENYEKVVTVDQLIKDIDGLQHIALLDLLVSNSEHLDENSTLEEVVSLLKDVDKDVTLSQLTQCLSESFGNSLQNCVVTVKKWQDTLPLLKSILEFDKFLISKNDIRKFDEYRLLPSISTQLCKREDLYKPDVFSETMLAILKNLAPAEVAKFVHPQFDSLELAYPRFEKETHVRSSIQNKIDDCNTRLVSKHVLLKECYLENQPIDANRWNSYALDYQNEVLPFMTYYSLMINPESYAFEAKVFDLLQNFYGTAFIKQNLLNKDTFDWRSTARLLINDAFYKFSLESKESQAAKAETIQLLVKTLFSYSDFKKILEDYRIYADRLGLFKYADQLEKDKDNDIQSELMRYYDTIVQGVHDETEENGGITVINEEKSIEHRLIDKSIEDFFIGKKEIDSFTLAREIEDVFGDESNLLNSEFMWNSMILEIVERLDQFYSQTKTWGELFKNLKNAREKILISRIEDQDQKSCMFKFMKTDKTKLMTLAKCADKDNLEEILSLGEAAYENICQEKTLNNYLSTLGSYVEDQIQKELQNELEKKGVRLSVDNEQGGQDLIVNVGHKDLQDEEMTPVYYIEIKSRWVKKDSVSMSCKQAERAVAEKEHYALIEADMQNWSRDKVMNHEPPKIGDIEFKSNLRAVLQIGQLIEERKIVDQIKDSFDNKDVIHISGDLNVSVAQTVWNLYGVSFDHLVADIKLKVKKYIDSLSDSD